MLGSRPVLMPAALKVPVLLRSLAVSQVLALLLVPLPLQPQPRVRRTNP